MFREWLSAAATSAGFFTGMTYRHELPTRQAAIIRDASLADAKPRSTEISVDFKAAAD